MSGDAKVTVAVGPDLAVLDPGPGLTQVWTGQAVHTGIVWETNRPPGTLIVVGLETDQVERIEAAIKAAGFGCGVHLLEERES